MTTRVPPSLLSAKICKGNPGIGLEQRSRFPAHQRFLLWGCSEVRATVGDTEVHRKKNPKNKKQKWERVKEREEKREKLNDSFPPIPSRSANADFNVPGQRGPGYSAILGRGSAGLK